MATLAPASSVSTPRSFQLFAAGALTVLLTAGALITWKASTALAALAKVQATGTMAPKAGWIAVDGVSAWLRPLAGAVNYFAWVWIALAFGVVLGAAVKALIPDRWLVRVFGGGGLGAFAGAVVGAPLMLCSCCVAPIFESVFRRTGKLAASFALMLSAPALNPFAIALTFLLFTPGVAATRLVTSLVMVMVGSAALGRILRGQPAPAECAVEAPEATWATVVPAFGRALVDSAWRTLPAIALGVVVSMLITQNVSVSSVTGAPAALVVVAVAFIATLIALPTFGEIPLALALAAAGAPEGAVVAMLVAGPAINLPSMFSLARAASARVAVAGGTLVFVCALVAAAVV